MPLAGAWQAHRPNACLFFVALQWLLAMTATEKSMGKSTVHGSGAPSNGGTPANKSGTVLLHIFQKRQMPAQAYQCAAALLLCEKQRQHGLEGQESQASQTGPDVGAALADSRDAHQQAATCQNDNQTWDE